LSSAFSTTGPFFKSQNGIFSSFFRINLSDLLPDPLELNSAYLEDRSERKISVLNPGETWKRFPPLLSERKTKNKSILVSALKDFEPVEANCYFSLGPNGLRSLIKNILQFIKV
jgi:hypothetical protein